MISLRNYQTQPIARILNCYKRHQAVNLTAFTGFGKTITSLYIAETLGAKRVLVVVPTHQLKMQWAEVVDNFKEIDVKVDLIHSVHKLTESFDFFVFDEAHMYGLENVGLETKMFESFISDPKHKNTKRLVLTATNFGVDSVFSGKGVAEVNVGIDEGIRCGALHDVHIRVITNGLEILADKFAGVKTHKSFQELAKTIEENNIDITSEQSKKVLMDCYATNLAAIVNAEHTTQKVLVYCKTIDECEELAGRYNALTGKEALVLHSKIKDGKAVLAKFKTSKDHNIIFNVNILTAGFDFDMAEVVFDFAFSQSNESRKLIQRLGRIARYKEGKAPVYYTMLTYSNGFRLEKATPQNIPLRSKVVSKPGETKDDKTEPKPTPKPTNESLADVSEQDRQHATEADKNNELSPSELVAFTAAQEVAIEGMTGILSNKSVVGMTNEDMSATDIDEPKTGVSTIEGVVEGEKVAVTVGVWHLTFASGTNEVRRVKVSDLVRRRHQTHTEQHKERLLKMALSGAPKPKSQSEDGKLLSMYVYPTSNSYDKAFADKILTFWPSQKELIQKTKALLMKMALAGETRPGHDTKLGQKLNSYTSQASSSYDEAFADKILPIWPRQKDAIQQTKELLLKMARAGESQPRSETKLGKQFNSYTTKASMAYDDVFTNEIRIYWPHRLDKTREYKQKLLDLARSGAPRPDKNSELGRRLQAFLNTGGPSYDPVFVDAIRKYWKSKVEKTTETKELLLDMAMRGEPCPKRASVLGKALGSFIVKSGEGYDSEFESKIRKYWPTRKDEVAAKKRLLIEMAKRGEPRPDSKSKLGIFLSTHSTKGVSFDPEFSEEIRKWWPGIIAKKKKE